MRVMLFLVPQSAPQVQMQTNLKAGHIAQAIFPLPVLAKFEDSPLAKQGDFVYI